MMIKIRIRPEAEEDIEDAATWYKYQSPNLGEQFLDEILDTLKTIAEFPNRFPFVYKKIQRALIHRFPFGIYYQKTDKYTVVLAVMHASRNPKRWKERT